MIAEQTRSTARRKPPRWGFWVGLLVVAGVLVGIWTSTHAGSKRGAGGRRAGLQGPVPVLAGDVTRADVDVTLAAVGSVEASASVSVRAQANGEVKAVRFTEGKPVAKGQVLYELDRAPLEADLRQAEAQMARDAASLAQARSDERRYASLVAQGYVSRQEAEQARSSASALAATVAAGRAAVENARVALGYATIRAPMAGVAGDSAVDAGNLVRSGDATPLVVINRVSPVLVTFSVPQNEIDRVRRYQRQHPIRVSATPRGGSAHTGTLVFVDNAVDAATGTLKLKASFPNRDGAMLPGQFADVVMTLATERQRVVAPLQALMPAQKGYIAYVLNPDSTVSEREVKLDRQVGALAVVASGLEPGERVITDGTLQLKDGAKVELRKDLIPPSPPGREGRGRHGGGQGPTGQGAGGTGGGRP